MKFIQVAPLFETLYEMKESFIKKYEGVIFE